MSGKLLNQTECSILIDTGTSKPYILKSYDMRCKSLHTLLKFASTMQRVQAMALCSSTVCDSSHSRHTWT